MARKLLWIATIAASVAMMHAQHVAGDWQGVLGGGPPPLHLAIHLTRDASGGLQGTFDSIDQGAMGISLSGVTLKDSTLTFRMGTGASYEGKLAGDEIHGMWTQGPTPDPLDFKRASAPRRPQEPKKPYPYPSEDVSYRNKAAGISLAATFTIPEGKGPFPAVVLITGSGPQDRDSSVFGHKPFLVLADYLTRHGIAVLRADDRGVARSGGNFASATSADFATDAEAGLEWLKTRAEADPRKLGLIGHSEGGGITAMVAARNKDVAFIVSLAGPALKGDEIIVEQIVAANEAAGAPHDMAVQYGDGERRILNVAEAEKDPAQLREKLAAFLPADKIDESILVFTSPWYREFLVYDPAADWRKVSCPVLALFGEKDTQVPAAQNIAAIRKALAENRQAEADEMPGLNHLFQHAKTGMLTEYSAIEETMSPDVLNKVAAWIRER
jgi:uncharacterized protein